MRASRVAVKLDVVANVDIAVRAALRARGRTFFTSNGLPG